MTDPECPVCGDTFSSAPSLRDHCWDAHGVCHFCGTAFEDEDDINAHWLTVHDDELSRSTRKRAQSTVGTPTFRDRLAHQGPASALAGVSVSRRTLLAGGAVGLGGLVGGTLLTTSFGDQPSIEDHQAADGLAEQPALGPAPTEADATIIAFEDPSCPSCARFERQTFPRLKSEHVEAGRLSFVFRGIPVVYDWGDPAVLALESTYARKPAAFWALKDFYYREQDGIGTGNVRSATRQFLENRTTVDAAAVIDDVDSATHQPAVDADLRASRGANVRGTPTFFLFRDGKFATEIVGPQSADVFENALGL